MKRFIARLLRLAADKLACHDELESGPNDFYVPDGDEVYPDGSISRQSVKTNNTVAEIKASRDPRPLPTEKERRKLEQQIIERLNLKPIQTKKVTLDEIKARHGRQRPGSKVRVAR